MKMKLKSLLFICLTTSMAFAAKHADFAGSWEFNPSKSQNVGMMMQMKMSQTIQQTPTSVDVLSQTSFQGNDQDMKTHYDLTGKAVTNDSPMAGPSETITKWDGDKLVTTWTSKSAVAGGPPVIRTETQSLSSDGNMMTIESVRGANPPVVIVFDKKR